MALFEVTLQALAGTSIDENLGASLNKQLNSIYKRKTISKESLAPTSDCLRLILLGARDNLTIGEFSKRLVKYAALEPLCTIYAEHVCKLRSLLPSIGYRPPTLVDVDWSLDHLALSNGGNSNAPTSRRDSSMYTLRLHLIDDEWGVEATKKTTIMTMKCGVDELEHFLGILKDANVAFQKLEKFGKK